MSKEHIDSRKTYAVQRSTLEAIGIELVIAQQEYEKQLIDKYPVEPDQVFYKEQIEYLDGLIKHLHEVTNNELLLI
jgi:soluble cytochrome b562